MAWFQSTPQCPNRQEEATRLRSENRRLENPREASSRPASTVLHEPQLVKGNARWLNQKSRRAKARPDPHKSGIIIYLFGLLISWSPETMIEIPSRQGQWNWYYKGLKTLGHEALILEIK